MASEPTTFALPPPPSTNRLYINPSANQIRYRNGKRVTPGRLKSPEYKAWINEAGWEMKRQHTPLPVYAGEVVLRVRVTTGIDIDNLKAVPDLLASMGVIRDDKLVWRLEVERGEGERWQVSLSDR